MENWYLLTGNIDSNLAHQVIAWFAAEVAKGTKKIKFFISSKGGDMDSAIRLYDFIKSIDVEIETYGFGQVDSSAITVFLTGQKRYCTENCRFLIHPAIFTANSKSNILEKHLEATKLFQALEDISISIISTETKNDKDVVKSMYKNSTILNSEEAKKLKFVDSVVKKFEFPKN